MNYVKPLGCVLTMAILAGCTQNHQNNKHQAIERWQSVQRDMTIEQAEQRFRSGNYNLALQDVQGIIKRYPDFVPAHMLAGRIYLEEGNFKQALSSFETCVNLDEKNDLAYYHMGVIYEKWNSLDRALENYQAAIAIRPRHTAYLVAAAETLVGMELHDRALEQLRVQLERYGPDVALLELSGGIYMHQQNYDQAERCYREALQLDDDNPEIMFALARVLQAKGRPVDALKLFDAIRVQMASSNQVNRYYDLVEAECLLMTGQWHRSIRLLEDIVKDQPDNVMAYVRLSQAWLARSQYPQAIQAAQSALALQADQPQAVMALGYAFVMQNDLEKALACYQQLTAIEPDNALAVSMIGYIYARMGNHDQAQSYLKQSAALQPDNGFAISLHQAIAQP